MVVKTYRGLLADDSQERIRLSTIKGKMGYRILKLQVIGARPGTDHYESVTQLWKKEQTSNVATIDFSDSDLLGVGLWSSEAATHANPDDMTVIFDREIFNQDIYITHKDLQGGTRINYYLELEVIPLASDEAAITTVKAMRGLAVD